MSLLFGGDHLKANTALIDLNSKYHFLYLDFDKISTNNFVQLIKDSHN